MALGFVLGAAVPSFILVSMSKASISRQDDANTMLLAALRGAQSVKIETPTEARHVVFSPPPPAVPVRAPADVPDFANEVPAPSITELFAEKKPRWTRA